VAERQSAAALKEWRQTPDQQVVYERATMIDNPERFVRLTCRPLLMCVGALASAISPVLSAEPPQSTSYSTFEVTAGNRVQLGYYATAKKDCSPAPVPTVRMIEPPRSGTLTVRRGLLSTNIGGCTGIKIPAQVAFYAARSGTTGKDHLIYEVTNPDGAVNVYDITIEIEMAVKPDKPGVVKSQPI
jgi:hypothetical protein